jgi:hydrogenase expression/formation protein HypE
LAVHGTVNDIAVSGGCPQWLSVSLILEEGLPMTTLRAVLNSIRDAARACGVIVATGDTKVVGRGQCDTLFVNTAGIGEAIPRFSLSPGNIREADAVIVSGTLGDHGVAVLTARESLPIQNGPQSDTAPVHRLVLALTPFAASLRVMRDPTRGGLASTLNELVNGLDRGIVLNESCLPFAPATKAVAEMLGLDLLHVASEGRMIAICAPEAAEGILEKWRKMPEGSNARQIGVVTSDAGRVILETLTGGRRLVDMPQGELLPRIC